MDNANATSGHPYQSLTPDVILDALASVQLYGDGRQMALSSYENRVYQVRLEDASMVVVKFYRPQRWTQAQILEEHAFAKELIDAEIPVVGPLTVNGNTLHHYGGFDFSVSPWRGGRQPELDDDEVLEWIGRFLARIHTVGAAQPFIHRPALNLASFGQESREWLLRHDKLPLDVQSAWEHASQTALDLIATHACLTRATGQNGLNAPAQDAAADEASDIRLIRLHGDCHPGNILWTPLDLPTSHLPGPHFVDLDDARTGPAVQDLWMLVSGDRQQRTRQLAALVDGYEQFRAFDRRELALIEPLRTLRLIHYSAWLARRWDDPTFPIHFPWFGSSDYWQGQVQMLDEQIEAMQEEPLVV
jgi:Ser/Thr protein kinase RdoA (MazF antagonist)